MMARPAVRRREAVGATRYRGWRWSGPGAGGIPRTTVQPGSVHAFESVDLYAMVSGYLKTQDVDIGSRVKKGEVLAEIDVPREAKAVEEAAALLDQARAQADQAEARVKTAEAERDDRRRDRGPDASRDVDRLVAHRQLAEKQFARIKDLARAEGGRVQARRRAAARPRRRPWRPSRRPGWRSRPPRPKLDGGRRQGRPGEGRRGRGRARRSAWPRRGWTRPGSTSTTPGSSAPFDGVVTHRGFHPGAFIRSAPTGGQLPC